MGGSGWLVAYSASILAVSLLGGFLPLVHRTSHTRLQLYLSLSAGVMLGAAFFHVMPEAMEISKGLFGWWMSLGVVGLFCIERFLAPHSHEANDLDENSHHGHDHSRAAAPPVAGWMAVLGLTIHTFMNGVGLAAAVQADLISPAEAKWIWPGLALFLAIVFHKPADALAITTVLGRKEVDRRKLVLVQVLFACMVPVGILAFHITQGAIDKALEHQFVGFALAFSAGTFLLIALSDLLPEVQFHRHDRVPLVLALLIGIVLMGGIAMLEPQKHEEPPAAQNEHEKGHDHHP